MPSPPAATAERGRARQEVSLLIKPTLTPVPLLMPISKSKGATPTEQLLAELCERTFLKLWSYPNPFNEDRKEFCDLLVVFENHVLIFFDRENRQLENTENDPMVAWQRWKRVVIDAQVKTASGAERYLRSGRPLFLDGDLKVPFPIPINRETMVVHKIIVAHGASEACKNWSDDNITGSLGIIYGQPDDNDPGPFTVDIDKSDPVHIFDSHNTGQHDARYWKSRVAPPAINLVI